MRILHVTSALVGGGAETQLKMLMRGLLDRGHEIGVIYLTDDPDFKSREGIDCIQIPRGKRWNLWKMYQRISKAINGFRPDVLHAWLPEIMTIPATLYCRLHDIPCVSAQRRSLRHVLSWKSRLRDWSILLPHLLANSVACNFSYAKEPWLLRKLIESKSGVVIRNGFLLPKQVPAEQPDWLETDAFKVLYVGRLVEQKRVDLLVQAIAELKSQSKHVQLAICGEGACESDLRILARASGLKESQDISFMGYQSSWQSLASHFDLFVLPSVAEGMPNVLVEAMGSGLPTVATNIFEISSFVEHGKHSFLVHPNCRSDLSKAMGQLSGDQEGMQRLAKAGQALAESLSSQVMVQHYNNLYTEIAKA